MKNLDRHEIILGIISIFMLLMFGLYFWYGIIKDREKPTVEQRIDMLEKRIEKLERE